MSEFQDPEAAARLRMSVEKIDLDNWSKVREMYAELGLSYWRASRMAGVLSTEMYRRYSGDQQFDRYVDEVKPERVEGIKGWFGVTKPVPIMHKSPQGWPLAEKIHWISTEGARRPAYDLLTGILMSRYGEFWTYKAHLEEDWPKEWRVDAWGNMSNQLALGERVIGTTDKMVFGWPIHFDVNRYDAHFRRISGALSLEDLVWNFAVQHEMEDVAREAVAVDKRH